MAKFYNISIAEFQDALKQEKGWGQETQHREVVFTYKLKKAPFIQVRVYSGISIENFMSRKVGQDAIRVASINLNTNAGWIKSKRVHRVVGWRENLKSRVIQVIKQSEARLR